jgi:tetratricopeptide (TPR) repeat protein
MKRIIFLITIAVFASACGDTPAPTQEKPTTNVNSSVEKTDDTLTVSSHSQDKTETKTETANAPKTDAPRKASPMERAVDVSKETEAIKKAEAEYKKDPGSKEALAAAYFERAFALTKAAQYRAALGDFRKGLKLDPNNESAKNMHDEIIRIFQSINREPPKEGEEPPPLPFDGEEKSYITEGDS